MAKGKNRYKQQAKKNQLIGKKGKKEDPAKGNIKVAALETGKALLIGAAGGTLVGAIFGRPAFLIGLATTGLGHYFGSRAAQIAGVGIMAANTFQKSSTTTVSGLQGLDGVKERMLAYKQNWQEKLYLDKIMKKKATTTTTNGVGNLDYFSYPDPMNGHLAALSDIENQIAESAMQFQGQMGSNNYSLEMNELEERLY